MRSGPLFQNPLNDSDIKQTALRVQETERRIMYLATLFNGLGAHCPLYFPVLPPERKPSITKK